jgi:chromosome partitioning protein
LGSKIISFINMKGGVGKTTLCKEVGYYLSHVDNKKVLLIDLDPQANLTQSYFRKFKYKHESALKTDEEHNFNITNKSVNNVLQPSVSKEPEKKDCLLELTDNLSIIPGNLDTVFVSRKTDSAEMTQSIYNFLFEYHDFSDYDYILIDCPPTYSEYTVAAILPSQYYIIPVKPDSYSILGIKMLEKVIRDIKTKHKIYFKNKPLKNLGVIFNGLPLKIPKGTNDLITKIKNSTHLSDIYFFENIFLQNNGFNKKVDYFINARNSQRSQENLHAIISEIKERVQA